MSGRPAAVAVAAADNGTLAEVRTAGNTLGSGRAEQASGNVSAYLKEGTVSVRSMPIPVRAPRHSLLRVLLAGICNTDLELQRGYYGFEGVPGHEFVAEVIESDRPDLPGRRVVGAINLCCGVCERCRSGLSIHCSERTVLGIKRHPGAFAQFVTLPDENLFPVPDSIPNEDAVWSEPVAAACAALDCIGGTIDEPVAVLGDGKLGLLIAQALRSEGRPVTVFGHHTERSRLVEGCRFTADSPRGLFAVVVECTGSESGLDAATRIVQPRGTVVLKSTINGQVSFDISRVVVNEIRMIGSRCGFIPTAIQKLQEGAVRVSGMTSGRYPLSRISDAFRAAARSESLKILIDVA